MTKWRKKKQTANCNQATEMAYSKRFPMTVLDSSSQVESEKQEEAVISSLCDTDDNTTWAVAVQNPHNT